MSSTDIVVVVVGLVVGYFAVSWLIGSVTRGKGTPAAGANRNVPPGGAWVDRDAVGDVKRPWYEVLQVPAYASLDDVKLAYRRRIAEYHPDRTAGLGEELRQLAEARAKEINVAYDAALRAFGQRGDSGRNP